MPDTHRPNPIQSAGRSISRGHPLATTIFEAAHRSRRANSAQDTLTEPGEPGTGR